MRRTASRDKNLGGHSLFHSAERIAAEKRYLKRQWKARIRFESYQSQDKTAIDVPRRRMESGSWMVSVPTIGRVKNPETSRRHPSAASPARTSTRFVR